MLYLFDLTDKGLWLFFIYTHLWYIVFFIILIVLFVKFVLRRR